MYFFIFHVSIPFVLNIHLFVLYVMSLCFSYMLMKVSTLAQCYIFCPPIEDSIFIITVLSQWISFRLIAKNKQPNEQTFFKTQIERGRKRRKSAVFIFRILDAFVAARYSVVIVFILVFVVVAVIFSSSTFYPDPLKLVSNEKFYLKTAAWKIISFLVWIKRKCWKSTLALAFALAHTNAQTNDI